MPRLIEAFEGERQGVGTQPHEIRVDARPFPPPKIPPDQFNSNTILSKGLPILILFTKDPSQTRALEQN